MKIKQLLILFIVLYYVPIHAQFSGDFAPSNWTFSSTTTGGDGSINTSGAPASVVLSGSDNDNGACCGLYENWAITIPQTGTISFSYSMVQPDIDNSYYVINGTTYSIATSTSLSAGTKIIKCGQLYFNDDARIAQARCYQLAFCLSSPASFLSALTCVAVLRSVYFLHNAVCWHNTLKMASALRMHTIMENTAHAQWACHFVILQNTEAR